MSIKENLKKYILADGFHVVVDTDRSFGSWIVDFETDKRYLDCYSQFASQALGWNHPYLLAAEEALGKAALHKIANADMYSKEYMSFVEALAKATPDFKHYFYVEGGALAVENALKAAFDWKVAQNPSLQMTDGEGMDVIHFKEAFHGRSGYTLSLTNNGYSDNPKTKWFPKFNWTRVTNPKITSNRWTGRIGEDAVVYSEDQAIWEMLPALERGKVAAIIIEPIQGEGGDNHFRKEFFDKLRELADQHQALLIFDEVQTGVGMTGKMWCYEHFGVIPDLLCFGKKTQVCGFCATSRIDTVKNNVFNTSSRINSTWGGNIVDMVRCTTVLNAIDELKLVDNAREVGDYFLSQLKTLESDQITNVRGKGLMLAFDLPSTEARDKFMERLSENMLALKSGSRAIRFRPALTFSKSNVDAAIAFLEKAISG